MDEQVKVEVGQVWEYDGEDYTITRRHEKNRGWRFGDEPGAHFGDSAFGHEGRYGLRLVSPAPATPPKVDRAGCKAWCGLPYAHRSTPSRYDSMMWFFPPLDNRFARDDEPAWCSATCRDARVPPLAAPVETAEASAPTDAECRRCGQGPFDAAHSGPYGHAFKRVETAKYGGAKLGDAIVDEFESLAKLVAPVKAAPVCKNHEDAEGVPYAKDDVTIVLCVECIAGLSYWMEAQTGNHCAQPRGPAAETAAGGGLLGRLPGGCVMSHFDDILEEGESADGFYSDQPCPKCGVKKLFTGYGLMGGGTGTYEGCDNCEYFSKTQDVEDLPAPKDVK